MENLFTNFWNQTNIKKLISLQKSNLRLKNDLFEDYILIN